MILRTEPATNLQALLELRQLCNKMVFPSIVSPRKLRQATPCSQKSRTCDKAGVYSPAFAPSDLLFNGR